MRQKVDLHGKCGSCLFAKETIAYGGSHCYVKCTNFLLRTRANRSGLARIKQRTQRACKQYKEKEDLD